MVAADLIRELEARGHGVTLADEDRRLVAGNRDELVEHLGNPLVRAGRAHHAEYLAGLGRLGRALWRQIRHEATCAACGRGARQGCDLGRRLDAEVVRLRDRSTEGDAP